MHAPATLYRLRDRLALTRPELTALLTVSALFGAGLVVQYLPAPPVTLGPDALRHHIAFVASPVAPEASVAVPLDSAATRTAPETKPRVSRKREATPTRPIGLNTASAAQLESLPRVGPKMAQRIVEYRAIRGGFRRVEELREVKGIGAKTLEQLRPFVTLD